MWKRGRKLFSTAAVLMILTAAAHTAGNLAPAPKDPALEKVMAAMNSYRLPLGMGMTPSLEEIYWDLVLTMSITFAALGAINLVLAASDASDRLLRRVSWANLVWIVAFIALSYAYRIPPALISGVVIAIFVAASIAVGPKAPSERH